MDKKTSNTLLIVSSGALAIGGLILLLISIFGETRDNWVLNFALAAILLSNLFNLIRLQRKRNEEQESKYNAEREFDHEKV